MVSNGVVVHCLIFSTRKLERSRPITKKVYNGVLSWGCILCVLSFHGERETDRGGFRVPCRTSLGLLVSLVHQAFTKSNGR